MGSEAAVQESALDLEGTYSIASAPANKAAIAPPGATHTAFTGELIRVLVEGLEEGPEELTLGDVYRYILDQMRRKPDLPLPQQAIHLDAASFVIARNVAHVAEHGTQPVGLPDEVIQLITSPFVASREGAVVALDRFLKGNYQGLANAAFEQLKALTNDDSRSVSSRAAEALANYHDSSKGREEEKPGRPPGPPPDIFANITGSWARAEIHPLAGEHQILSDWNLIFGPRMAGDHLSELFGTARSLVLTNRRLILVGVSLPKAFGATSKGKVLLDIPLDNVDSVEPTRRGLSLTSLWWFPYSFPIFLLTRRLELTYRDGARLKTLRLHLRNPDGWTTSIRNAKSTLSQSPRG